MEHEIANVCHESFVSSADISCVTMENYGIGNLYSSDSVARSKGLKVERFVRPPFTITFQFRPLIHITHIVLHVDSDDGGVCKFQVFVTRANESTRQYLKNCGTFMTSSHGRVLVLNNKLWVRSDFEIPNTVLGSHLHARLFGQQLHSQTLHSTQPLRAVKHVVMTILHMSGAKPFNLKALEVWAIWGDASDRTVFEKCKSALIQAQPTGAAASTSVYQVDRSTSEAFVCDGSSSIIEAQFKSNKEIKQVASDGPGSIPERFLDELTYQLMTLPMILPSEHHVDQSTVEKTRELDLLYSRPPSDPFTGIPYTDRQKPQFAACLKTEIDAFVINNSFMESNRTVGSAEDIIKHRSQLGNDKAVHLKLTSCFVL